MPWVGMTFYPTWEEANAAQAALNAEQANMVAVSQNLNASESTFTDSVDQIWTIIDDGEMISDSRPDAPANLTPTWITSLESIAPTVTEKITSQQQADEPWWVTAQRILSALILTNQQRQLMQINIERAKRGEPPLSVADYAGVGVQVGVSQDTQKLITYGGLALLGYLVFNTLARR